MNSSQADLQWRSVTVDDIKADLPNALATGPFGSSISSKFFRAEGVPVIRGSNLSEDINIRLSENGFVFVSSDLARKFRRSIAKFGDLIFTCWGTIGQVGLIDKNSRYEKYIVSNKQMKFTPNHKEADSHYLYYLFSSPEVSSQIKTQAIGSSVPGFNLGQLRSIRFLLPKLDEQRAIAHILCALDNKIELNRQMNRTLEQTAQAIFKSWFVDFDPVVAKADGRRPYGMDAETAELFPDTFKDSEFGFIPQGWRFISIADAFEINPRRSLSKNMMAPYLDMQNMPVEVAQPNTWSERPFGSGTKFTNGDTLLARITPCLENGKTAYVDFLDREQIGWGSTEYIVLRAKSPYPLEFSYFLARSPEFRNHAIANMTGSSGRQRVPIESLRSFDIPLPSDAVLEKFGEFAKNSLRVSQGNINQSRTLFDIRDALLPKLLSGELRVPQAEKIVEEVL